MVEKLKEQNEKLQEEKSNLEEEKANGFLPKELFNKIFGDDQIKHLQNGRVNKWTDETIQKSLKLRYAAGARGKFLKKLNFSGNIPVGKAFFS